MIENDSSDYDSTSSQELMPQLLPINYNPEEQDETFDEEANNFLIQVREEALQISDIMTNNEMQQKLLQIENNQKKIINQPKTKNIFEINKVTQEWKSKVLDQFNQLNQINSKFLNGELSCDDIQQIDFETSQDIFQNQNQFQHLFNDNNENTQIYPKFSVISKFDFISINKMIEWIYNLIDRSNQINYFQCLWFYTLLSMLQKPLLPEISYYLIQISKKLEDFLQSYQNENQQEYIYYKAMILTLVLIIQEYFGQKYN